MAEPTGLRSARLPSGRHRLPREFVIRSQRDRLLDAIARACAEKGYGSVRIADVVERARVSRTTFYELFSDKEECFLAAYDAILDKFLTKMVAAAQGAGPSWPDQIRAGLDEMLAFMVAEPAFARMCLVDVLATGPRAIERYQSAVGGISGFVDAGRNHAPGREELQPQVASAVVGGATLVIRDEILAGNTDELPRLAPDILYSVLVPYMGQAEALGQIGMHYPDGGPEASDRTGAPRG